ncbi:hypothetical protein CEP51_005910 [Fusarium floridanum]|uniref:Beta-lactamase-related domain-containing protein n=1 Tax=Fusarium floridanum TaxID=1325733 RepID=A0A428RUX3_9HYPO|nr:hypothetical protein CEP51_005910 [Fusarium floridanum]
MHRASPKYYLVSVKGSRRTPIRASMAAVASSEYKSVWAFFCELVRVVRPRAISIPIDPFYCRRMRRAVKVPLGISGTGHEKLQESVLIFLILLLGIYNAGGSADASALLLRQFRQTENLVESLAKSLKDLVQSSKSWNASTNSFFVKVTSKDESLSSFHHTADSLEETGVHKVISSFIYRVASVTKIFTVLALLLQNNLDLDDPASKYVPEMFRIKHCKEMKLRRLAGQLGAGKYAFDLATSLVFEALRALGFLEAPPMPGAPVYDTADTRPKTYIEFSESLKDNILTWKPGQRAANSNSGFTILGFVLENLTLIKFKEIIREKISKPLSLPSATGFVVQDLLQAVLPPDRGSELVSIPSETMAPGPYKTPEDLAKFVRSILHHDLLSSPRTDLQIKPTSFLSTAQGAVGTPREIY